MWKATTLMTQQPKALQHGDAKNRERYSLSLTASNNLARSFRAFKACDMVTWVNLVGVWGCNWPIKSMSAEITAPTMK